MKDHEMKVEISKNIFESKAMKAMFNDKEPHEVFEYYIDHIFESLPINVIDLPFITAALKVAHDSLKDAMTPIALEGYDRILAKTRVETIDMSKLDKLAKELQDDE